MLETDLLLFLAALAGQHPRMNDRASPANRHGSITPPANTNKHKRGSGFLVKKS